MDLIEYLTSYKKGKQIRKKKIRKGRIPRRARGFGQRGSKYNSSKNQNDRDNIDKQLLALLTILTKQNQSKIDLSKPEALNPFVERDRQLYSMSGNKVQKAIELPKEESIKIKETKGLIFNVSQDLDMRVNEVLEDQQELLSELKGVDIISPELAREVRNKNLQLKEQVLSETVRIQELLNEAEDLNDYRDIIQKQNKMIDNTTKGFVEIDNELSERQVKETEKLEKSTEIMEEEFVNVIHRAEGWAEKLSMKEDECVVLEKEIEDLKLTLDMKEDECVVLEKTLKLTLEKSESKEQKLKQQLTEMESIIDKMENQNITQPLSPLQEAERFLEERKK